MQTYNNLTGKKSRKKRNRQEDKNLTGKHRAKYETNKHTTTERAKIRQIKQAKTQKLNGQTSGKK